MYACHLLLENLNRVLTSAAASEYAPKVAIPQNTVARKTHFADPLTPFARHYF
jgi:hypothetical protein